MNLQEFKTESLKLNFCEVVKARLINLTEKEFLRQLSYTNHDGIYPDNYRVVFKLINQRISQEERYIKTIEYHRKRKEYFALKRSYLY